MEADGAGPREQSAFPNLDWGFGVAYAIGALDDNVLVAVRGNSPSYLAGCGHCELQAFEGCEHGRVAEAGRTPNGLTGWWGHRA